MYALIHQQRLAGKPQKRVVSIHASRKDSERALEQRKKRLGKDEWECNTRVIWTDKALKPGDIIEENQRLVWR